jgi:nucleotide-binding universal stress UspA family protein
MLEGQRFRRVLIPLDGSATAEAAIPAALELAMALGLEVILLQVVAPVMAHIEGASRAASISPLERLQQQAEDYLGRYADSFCAQGLRACTDVRVGYDTAAEIVAAARDHGADLIAMTTHGRSGLRRLLFGSVAEIVLRRSPIPVFLVRINEAEEVRQAA